MEDENQNANEAENYGSDTSEFDESLPSAVRIFSLFREALPSNQDDNSTDTESECSEGESVEPPPPDPDEQTRTLPCEHKVAYLLIDFRFRLRIKCFGCSI